MRKTERIYGPTQHGKRWRLDYRVSGNRRVISFTSHAAAQAALERDLARLTGGASVGEAVRDFCDSIKATMKPASVTTTRHRLEALLELVVRTPAGVVCRDRPIEALTPKTAQALYTKRTTEVKPDTHHNELAAAKRWGAWCCAQGLLRLNPFEGIAPVGRKNTGKPQLRADEARRYLQAALDEATDAGLAVAMALLLGLRASEVTDRVARDVDDGGRILWIPFAKTRVGVRALEVPDVIRPSLVAKAGALKPIDRLFGDVDRQWMYYHVKRLCVVAGVPVVPPHGLRGTFTSLAAGAIPVAAVARALGHTSGAVTRRHYMAEGVEQNADAARVAALVAAPASPTHE